MNETLTQIYQRHCVTGPDCGHGDKGGTHSYIDVYERLLAPYRSKCTFMEIGLAMGLSLAMWREYMPTSTIVGVDLSIVFDPKPHLAHEKTILIEADATSPSFPTKLYGRKFDVIIDDGSHMTADQCATFKLLAPLMNRGGIYVIEDILNLEASLSALQALHYNMEIYDLRNQKGRFDDVLVVYRF